MSSEYIYDRRAVTLVGNQSSYTALFIQSHSNNVDPYIPRWSLQMLTKKGSALGQICQYAYYCDDGMTRGAKGKSITGEYEIACWRRTIAEASTIERFVGTITFFENAYAFQLGYEKLEKLMALAKSVNVTLPTSPLSSSIKGIETEVGLNVYIDFSDPAVVDLVWLASRDNTDADSKEDSYRRLVLPGDFLKPLTGSTLFRNSFATQNASFVLDPKPETAIARTSDYVMQETIVKFEFPVDGQPVYKDVRFVIMDWQCRVLCTDPFSWFCKKLETIESNAPGTAESAYRKFKALMKDLPVTPHEGMTIEAFKPANTDNFPEWAVAKISRLFESGTSVIYTESMKDHFAVLGICDFVQCNLALPGLKPEQPVHQDALFDLAASK